MDSNFKKASLEDIVSALDNFQYYAISGHINPDGDSIGSCLCLAYCLEQLGKSCYIINSDNSKFNDKTFTGQSFCFVQLDVQPAHRLVKEAIELKEAAKFSICIDHHPQEEPNCNLVYVDSTAAANALNVWDLVKLTEVQINKDIAQWAYYGLCSDTNSFTNTNSDLRAFMSATEMIRFGADPSFAAKRLFQSRSLASFQLEKLVLDRLYVDVDNRFAFSYLTHSDYIKYNATKDDSDAAINLLRELECVDVACIIRQEKAGDKVHGSLRSKTDCDVSKMAKLHIGGGHKAAAGFTMETTNMDSAIETVKSQLKELCQGNL